MNLCLKYSMAGVAIIPAILTGVQYDDDVTDYPLICSTSPSDFWGRRWNNLIHDSLKQGVYKPVRWYGKSRTVAFLAAFFASGLIHEYVWVLLFHQTTNQQSELLQLGEVSSCCAVLPDMGISTTACYCQTGWFGKQLIFFGWNGILISLEFLFQMVTTRRKGVISKDKRTDQLFFWERINSLVPWWFKCHIVVLLSLPVGHLFTADVIHSGMMTSLQLGLPLFRITVQK